MKEANEKRLADAVNVKCDEIQPLLFDFITHELPMGRADIVREHIRKCEHCQASASEIKATLDLLGKAANETARLPVKLSDERRKKILWSFMHPMMHKLEKHHLLISIILAVIITIIVIVAAARIRFIAEGSDAGDGVEVDVDVIIPAGEMRRMEKVPPRPKTEETIVEPKAPIE